MAEIIKNIGSYIPLIAAVIAIAAIYFPWRARQSERYLDQAIISLERAYSVLSNDGKVTRPPLPDRLNWLTCARLILKYQKIKKLIACKEHQLVCEEQEEYWRHQFYLCLNATSALVPAYYQEDTTSGKAPIEPRSAILVHNFAKWPENTVDPIDLVDIDKILEKRVVLQGNIGLKHYLNSLPTFRERFRP